MTSPAPPRPVVATRQQHSMKPNSAAAATVRDRPPTQILAAPRQLIPRLKMVIRRLPPGLKENEFVSTLGDEWKVGGERVDWLSYKEGKVSRDISKPSRPGRAYLHLTKADFLTSLTSVIRDSSFTDIRVTSADSCLLGPPYLEFAPYGRIPSSRPRKDARQGTIDQDTEFIDFLQDLTNPLVKPAPLESTVDKDQAGLGDLVTPLVQFLRDKKANKNKDNVLAKGGKQARSDIKEAKGRGSDRSSKIKDSREPKVAVSEKKTTGTAKSDKSARESSKLSTRAAVLTSQKTSNGASVATAARISTKSQETTEPVLAPIERKRNKVGPEAKSLLQRDLGMATGGRRRRAEASSVTNQTSKSTEATSEVKAVPNQNASTKATVDKKIKSATPTVAVVPGSPGGVTPVSAVHVQAPSGPATSRTAHANTGNPTKNTQGQPASGITRKSSSTQAFVKHANQSQGVTEALLRETLGSFGHVETIDIDKKKGFAYVTFAESESLCKAIAASPVKVAQGQVVVLERKEGKGSTARPRANRATGRGRSGGHTSAAGRGEKQAPNQTATPTPAAPDLKT